MDGTNKSHYRSMYKIYLELSDRTLYNICKIYGGTLPIHGNINLAWEALKALANSNDVTTYELESFFK